MLEHFVRSDILDIIPFPILEYAPVRDEANNIIDLTFLWANADAREALVEEGEDIVGKRVLELHPHFKENNGYGCILKAIETGETQQIVIAAGKISPFAGKYLKLFCKPTPSGCIVMMQDITDIVNDRDNAQTKFSMLDAACTDAVNGIAIADDKHRLVYANPALCKALGYTKEEMIGKAIGDLMEPSENLARYDLVAKLLSEEIDQYVVDRKYVTKTGETILMSVAVSTTHGKNGEVWSLAHFRDVREERRSQHALRSALAKAQEATRMKSEFLANMSHEIRTPLNGVIGMAQVLAFSDLSPQQAEHVSIIRDSGSNLMSLLNDILDLSKVEAGQVDVNPIEVDVRHKLNRVYKLHEPIAREKGIALDFVIHPSLPARLQLDPVRLHQCVANLVSNAVKFTAEGRVTIAITSEPISDTQYQVIVHVSDTGIGIAPEKLETVFESFQQADGSTTRSFGGTGLGLTITRKLARLMGGDLTVVSAKGRGSIFTLTILANSVPKVGIHQERFLANQPPMNFSDLRVLIVDDNVINRKVAASFLRTYNFKTSEAIDGLDALEKLAQGKYDLILMDVHMPSMDGITAARELRVNGTLNTDIPVIALTADAMSGDRERYLAQGMDGYVSKPINERELISEIGAVMTRSVEIKGKNSLAC